MSASAGCAVEPASAGVGAVVGVDPVKQRHTAKRIGGRHAAEHGVVISQSRVRTVVARLRLELTAPHASSVMVPQEHPPGAAAKVHRGDFTAVIGGVSIKLQLFVMRSSHSTAGFHRGFAHATQESWLDAHARGFFGLGRVPRRIQYDNLKTAVSKVLTGRGRVENDRFTAMRSFYLFDSFFCQPGNRGQRGHHPAGSEPLTPRRRRTNLRTPTSKDLTWVAIRPACHSR